MAIVSSGPRLEKWHLSSQTHSIHMTSGRSVVQCIHDHGELLVKVYTILVPKIK